MYMIRIIVFLLLISNSFASNYSAIFSNNKFNITSLMNAVSQNDAKATEVFLKSGANVNESNMADVSPLHIAAKNNSTDAMKVLLQYNANIDAKDDEGWTPLMRACLNKHKESVEILVNNNANLWLRNNFNETALLHCVMANCVECVEILKNKFNKNNYDKNIVLDEINKALIITYRREDKKMEEVLNLFYDNVANRNTVTTDNSKDEKLNKKSKKEDKKTKEEKMDEEIKKEIEYIIRKIYIFQGEVRYLNSKKN